MAKTTETGMVELTIPYDPANPDRTEFLCVNGKNIRVRCGETVMVDPAYKEVWDNKQRQLMEASRAGAKIAKRDF